MRSLFTGMALVLLAACSPAPRPIAAAPSPQPVTSTPVTTTPPAPEPQSTVVAAPPCGPAVRACVSLSEKLAWLMKDGVVQLGPVPITHGRPGQRTPVGTFSVSWKDAVHTSSVYRTPMPHSVFFAPGGIAFHEGSLTEESHGCVHLSPENAKTFFDTLAVKALVQIVP
jgi:lipoprotein-anchoring transpeptidase ErfK/SrfK